MEELMPSEPQRYWCSSIVFFNVAVGSGSWRIVEGGDDASAGLGKRAVAKFGGATRDWSAVTGLAGYSVYHMNTVQATVLSRPAPSWQKSTIIHQIIPRPCKEQIHGSL